MKSLSALDYSTRGLQPSCRLAQLPARCTLYLDMTTKSYGSPWLPLLRYPRIVPHQTNSQTFLVGRLRRRLLPNLRLRHSWPRKSGGAHCHAKEVGHPRILETATGRSPLKGHHATKPPFESAGPEKLQHSFLL